MIHESDQFVSVWYDHHWDQLIPCNIDSFHRQLTTISPSRTSSKIWIYYSIGNCMETSSISKL